MVNPAGHNPMRWDCAKAGCFNEKCRPKIEVFAACFPGAISFGDVDGLVEYQGFGLLLEWKPPHARMRTGQLRAHKNLSETGLITVFEVRGWAETMEVQCLSTWYKGKKSEPIPCNLEELKQHVRAWAEWAELMRWAP